MVGDKFIYTPLTIIVAINDNNTLQFGTTGILPTVSHRGRLNYLEFDKSNRTPRVC